jgi:thiol:disulfide interchange protein DsbC
MRKELKMAVSILLAGITFVASVTAQADEAEIKANMLKQYPEIKIRSVTKAPIAGLWEVFADGQIFYTDAKADYMIMDGTLVEVSRRANVTDERLQKLNMIKFSDLPLEMAIKEVKGSGARKLAVFTDPDCPYCRQLQQELTNVNNVTIYYFLFPIVGLHPNAPEIARQIWCSPNRTQAWLDYMATRVKPTAPSTCDTPVDKIVAFGQSKSINGTPAIIFANGQRVPGAIGAAQIEQILATAQVKQP